MDGTNEFRRERIELSAVSGIVARRLTSDIAPRRFDPTGPD